MQILDVVFYTIIKQTIAAGNLICNILEHRIRPWLERFELFNEVRISTQETARNCKMILKH